MIKSILTATTHQKVLDFLIQHPSTEYLAREIQEVTKLSKAGTHLVLRDLVKTGLVKKAQRGKFYLYTTAFKHPVIKQLKVLQIITSLFPLVKKITARVIKIILYGSTSRGENTKDSDIDLFVVTDSPDIIKETVETKIRNKKIQLTAKTPLEYVVMKKTEPTFCREIEQGIVLWESSDES